MILNKDIQKVLEEVGFRYSIERDSGDYYIYNNYPAVNVRTFEISLEDSSLDLRLTSKNIVFLLFKSRFSDDFPTYSLKIKEWKISREMPIEEFSKIFLVSIIKGSFLWLDEN